MKKPVTTLRSLIGVEDEAVRRRSARTKRIAVRATVA